MTTTIDLAAERAWLLDAERLLAGFHPIDHRYVSGVECWLERLRAYERAVRGGLEEPGDAV